MLSMCRGVREKDGVVQMTLIPNLRCSIEVVVHSWGAEKSPPDLSQKFVCGLSMRLKWICHRHRAWQPGGLFFAFGWVFFGLFSKKLSKYIRSYISRNKYFWYDAKPFIVNTCLFSLFPNSSPLFIFECMLWSQRLRILGPYVLVLPRGFSRGFAPCYGSSTAGRAAPLPGSASRALPALRRGGRLGAGARHQEAEVPPVELFPGARSCGSGREATVGAGRRGAGDPPCETPWQPQVSGGRAGPRGCGGSPVGAEAALGAGGSNPWQAPQGRRPRGRAAQSSRSCRRAAAAVASPALGRAGGGCGAATDPGAAEFALLSAASHGKLSPRNLSLWHTWFRFAIRQDECECVWAFY